MNNEDKYNFWLNVLCWIGNIIIILLSFGLALVNKWWLCLFLPLIINFHTKNNDKEED